MTQEKWRLRLENCFFNWEEGKGRKSWAGKKLSEKDTIG